jgi:sugar-specific transcriptional regulator TrmB
MSDIIKNEIIEFLKGADLSNYEINAYMALLNSEALTAREIGEKSGVPSGRIYEILEELKNKAMVEIQDSRPKKYKALTFNKGFQNLISHFSEENTRKVSFLIEQAKILENKIYNSDLFFKKESSKIFWSTAFCATSIISLYVKKSNETKEEILDTGFLNENTFKVLPRARNLYKGIYNALKRGVQVKYLWSFEYDNRTLPEELINKNFELFNNLKIKFKELFDLSCKKDEFEMKFIHRKIPTYYDIFDKKRVLVKLQNPLKPYQFFACMDMLDPNLANELREKFLEIWEFEAIE